MQNSTKARRGSARRGPSVAVTAALAVLFIAVITIAVFSLRTLFYDFGVREVVIRGTDKQDTPGKRFDRALLDQIDAFEYVKSFDHVLERGLVRSRVKALRMDRCEVRQGEFYKFVQWRKRKKNRNKPIAAPAQPRNWAYLSNNRQHAISGRLKAPANGVTYYDAYAYCKAAGGHLPFGDEWIAAAAGRDARLYPWGDEFNEFDWPYIDPLLNAAQRCGLHRESATPDGVRNLGGVVSEWTQNRASPLKPTIHGGNAYNQPREIYGINRFYRYAPPEYRSPYVGFRCVYGGKRRKKTPWKTALDTARIKPGEYETGIPPGARLPSLLTNLPRDKIYLLKRLFQSQRQRDAKTLFVMEREVTRRQYAGFLRDPLVHLGLYADKNEPKDQHYRPADWGRQMDRPDLPVINVDWWSAHAFAAWAGGRLPTADEWIATASSQGRNIYPWGNEFIHGNAAGGEQRLTSARAAADTGDVTADGLRDMGGNVSEWTQSTDVADGGYIIVVKGGNYLLPGETTARMDFKNTVPPNHRSPAIGLRVVFDRKPVATAFPREIEAEAKPETEAKPEAPKSPPTTDRRDDYSADKDSSKRLK